MQSNLGAKHGEIHVEIAAGNALLRMLGVRQRGVVHVHEHGIAIVLPKQTRSIRYRDIRSLSASTLHVRPGEQIHLAPAKDHSLALLEDVLRNHGLEAARAQLARGESIALFDDKLTVTPEGLLRGGVLTPWQEADVSGDDKRMVLTWSKREEFVQIASGQRLSAAAVSMPADVIPDFAIVREQLSKHAVRVKRMKA